RHEKSAPFPVPKGKVEPGLKSHEVPVRPNNNGHSSKQSYASVANGVVASKGVSSIGTLNISRSILLNEHDLIKVDKTSIVVLVKMKEVDMISNMYCIYRNKGFIDVKIHYVGRLWVWIEFENKKICETFKSNVSLNSLWSSIMSVSPSFIVDERLIWIEISGLPLCAWGSNMGPQKKIRIWSTRIINDLDGSDLDDSFEENKSHSSYENEDKNEELDDFIEQVVEDKIMSKSTNDFHHVEEEVIGSKPKEESAKEVDSNATIPPGFKELGRSGKDNSDNFIIVEGKWMNFAEDYFLINVYGPHHQPDKSNLWDSHRSFIQSHGGNIILFEDMNEVRCETKRKDFDVVVKEACNSLLVTNVGSTMALHVKVKELKAQLKLRFSRTKVSEVSRKNSILVSLKSLDDKIHAGQATYEDKRLRVNTWHELDNLVNLESMGMFQKARVRWDVEGEENTKFFYGIINSKRNTRMIKGILHEGTWITDPLDIKSAFLNFYKAKLHGDIGGN
ncbi:hypothetical protein Tco_1127901, partial [Tanacetum coccineum]